MFNSGDLFIFTVRSQIKSEPRVTQERVYVTPYEYKLVCMYDSLIYDEKGKKKPDKAKMNLLKTELYKLSKNKEKHELFTDGGIYYNCLGRFIESKEGWYNLKKK